MASSLVSAFMPVNGCEISNTCLFAAKDSSGLLKMKIEYAENRRMGFISIKSRTEATENKVSGVQRQVSAYVYHCRLQ
jgi:hypothetical protein